eukprot:CAMPEP_0170549138 /NCGR_PEP_ID=MMETSP0211-20121228/7334_1 /TAXON_ID=311385 /ORGANISM="Pseudokeronopsis sp., Strain OXSARD2" /LENGTH=76 /DNA_ID=CAMNT_0010854993 /DNA_START=2493 /DNA_END=2723 /DNA_ORIENTATION=+
MNSSQGKQIEVMKLQDSQKMGQSQNSLKYLQKNSNHTSSGIIEDLSDSSSDSDDSDNEYQDSSNGEMSSVTDKGPR